MSDQEILEFPMMDLLDKRSILFMWATSPRLDFCIRAIENWKLHYRGVSFVWVKTNKAGQPMGARGVRPSIVKPTCEFVLAASPVATGRPLKLHDESIVNTVLSPVGEHSAKPEAVQDRIESMYPNSSKLELFGRRQRPGWLVWGNETEKFSPALDSQN
jgi:N6-adenosine-specific RNA methylase IME4